MNHREPPRQSAALRKASICLAGLIALALAPSSAHAFTHLLFSTGLAPRTAAEPAGYLTINGAPTLRFQEPPVKPDPTPLRGAAASPSATSSNASTDAMTPATSPSVPSSGDATAGNVNVAPKDAAPAKGPAPILPDETRPVVRPEDFLPYFQIPGSARNPADVTLLVPVAKTAPAPASIPPSSATYTQTPK